MRTKWLRRRSRKRLQRGSRDAESLKNRFIDARGQRASLGHDVLVRLLEDLSNVLYIQVTLESSTVVFSAEAPVASLVSSSTVASKLSWLESPDQAARLLEVDKRLVIMAGRRTMPHSSKQQEFGKLSQGAKAYRLGEAIMKRFCELEAKTSGPRKIKNYIAKPDWTDDAAKGTSEKLKLEGDSLTAITGSRRGPGETRRSKLLMSAPCAALREREKSKRDGREDEDEGQAD